MAYLKITYHMKDKQQGNGECERGAVCHSNNWGRPH